MHLKQINKIRFLKCYSFNIQRIEIKKKNK